MAATVVVVVVSAFGQPVTIVKLTIPGLDLGCKACYFLFLFFETFIIVPLVIKRQCKNEIQSNKVSGLQSFDI